MSNVIEVSNFSFTYKNAKQKAVEDISLEVRKGEILGIIGPTGAGKTTLCRGITGIVPQIFAGKFEGEISVLGKSVRDYTIAELAGIIGYVHQDAESQLLMTNIEKEIVFPLENLCIPRKEIKERLEKSLRLVHLEQYRNRHPYYLSGGQRQRVVLATALAMNPEILILDEATSEIDPIGAEEIMAVAKELNELGKTIILIEHNMEELALYADRIVVLEEGKKLAEGLSKDILANKEVTGKLDIYPPEVTQLAMALVKRGIKLDDIPVELSEAEALLKKLFVSSKVGGK